MTNKPPANPQTEHRRGQHGNESSPPSRNLYADLCALDNLQQGFAHVKENCPELGIDPLTLEAIEAEGSETFLQKLSDDLQTRTYKPTPTTNESERGGIAALRDLLVQAALQRLLEPVFPPAFPNDPQAENTIKRIAGHIEKGFSRVYAVNVEDYLATEQHKRILAAVRQRIDDADLIHLLASILAIQEKEQPGLLAPLLADIALESLDAILQQTKAFGREDNFLHVHCIRVANQIVILLDNDSRYDWLLPAARKRIREELANFHYDLAAVETQSVDLTRGGSLRFLNYELRLVKGKQGEPRVRYRLLDATQRRRAGRGRRYRPLRFLRPCANWIGRRWICRLVGDACRKTHAIQVGWRHLPITLFPVLLLYFGWRSPAAWLCLAAIFVCNWRWTLGTLRSEPRRGWRLARRTCLKAQTIQVGWRHLPITVFPVLMLFFGWRSLVPWLGLAAIFLCNWRWTLGTGRSTGVGAWRHKANVMVGTCVLGAFVSAFPIFGELYTHRSHEDAAVAPLPPGFYRGEYNKGSPLDGDMVHYGLYVPPHFHNLKGPFPLIVFLHGYGERNDQNLLRSGLPRAIAQRVGPQGNKQGFEFVAFFPLDPTGQWQADSTEMEGMLRTLDYVVQRHHIDPKRIYLTGHSAGGSGVWVLAQTYPDKWAAVVPVCSFTSPDVPKVRHIPAWIFHGDKDKRAPVDRERLLVQQLKEAKADVRYTEIPNKGHIIWPQVYGREDLYLWLADKKKG